ncbi:MAG: dihydropteroate synthase [Proteobacteria bacterium]|nr:dihydropteroate synthase [Pseudomonadota bacterium]
MTLQPRSLAWEGGSLPADRCSVMAILNVTPDSFFDGGRYAAVDAAVARAFEAIDEGADVLDIGGESTRPGSAGVTVEEELARVVPVLQALRDRGCPLPISIDTSRAAVAAAAVELGAVLVNDVSGGSREPEILDVAASAGAAVVLMHMRGSPRTMQSNVRYDDLFGEVSATLAACCEAADAAGIPADRQAIDPGIGFGKSPQGCLDLIARLDKFASLDRAVLVGASRKSFLGRRFGLAPADRLVGSAVIAAASAERGASIVRVHDVAASRQAVDIASALRKASRP